jgi:hypothetical protein
MTDSTALWALGISAASLLVSIGTAIWNGRNTSRSITIATEAKEQARKTALLEPRTEAIEYLRQALQNVRDNHLSVTASSGAEEIRRANKALEGKAATIVAVEISPPDRC